MGSKTIMVTMLATSIAWVVFGVVVIVASEQGIQSSRIKHCSNSLGLTYDQCLNIVRLPSRFDARTVNLEEISEVVDLMQQQLNN